MKDQVKQLERLCATSRKVRGLVGSVALREAESALYAARGDQGILLTDLRRSLHALQSAYDAERAYESRLDRRRNAARKGMPPLKGTPLVVLDGLLGNAKALGVYNIEAAVAARRVGYLYGKGSATDKQIGEASERLRTALRAVVSSGRHRA